MKKEHLTLKEIFHFVEKIQQFGIMKYIYNYYWKFNEIKTNDVLTEFFSDKINKQFSSEFNSFNINKKSISLFLTSIFLDKYCYDYIHITYFFGKNNILLSCYGDKKYKCEMKLICSVDILDKVLKEWITKYTILKDKNGKEYKRYSSSLDFFNKIKQVKKAYNNNYA